MKTFHIRPQPENGEALTSSAGKIKSNNTRIITDLFLEYIIPIEISDACIYK